MKISDNHIKSIKKLCRQYRVKSLFAFGSVIGDYFQDDSDIDFVVDFEENDPFVYTDLYFNLKERLELLLQRQVDLIEERGIRNVNFRKTVDAGKVLIYAQ